jgi:hypothetical protein
MKRQYPAMRMLTVLALGLMAVAPVVSAQEPLQFNVPYRCPDGTTKIIQRCQSNARGEVCFWREEKDGQLIVERFNIRSQMDGWLKICLQSARQAQPAPAQAAVQDSGVGLNPPYLKDIPSVDRVKAEIKGSDPTDTLARQVAVFTYLSEYIKRIKYNRTVRGPYTPDEARVMGAYDLAAYQISQDYANSHTPAEATSFERLHGQYEMNAAFKSDWNKRLMGPQSAAAYKNAETQLAATGQAHYEQEMRDYQRDRAAQQAADKQIFGTQELSNDPTAVATRRCLELGGSSVACLGKGFASGFMDLIGFNTEDITGPGRAGVILQGVYKNPATTATLTFGATNVSIQGCGKLVAEDHNYTIDKRPGSLQVMVQNEPHTIVLTMRPDGGFTGPGLIDIKGNIIIGYHTVTNTL